MGEKTINNPIHKLTQDMAVMAVQMGHVAETQNRIEKMFESFRHEWRQDIKVLRAEMQDVDGKHTKNYQSIKSYIDSESRVNLKFRTKVVAYATTGSLVGGLVWQVISTMFFK